MDWEAFEVMLKMYLKPVEKGETIKVLRVKTKKESPNQITIK